MKDEEAYEKRSKGQKSYSGANYPWMGINHLDKYCSTADVVYHGYFDKFS